MEEHLVHRSLLNSFALGWPVVATLCGGVSCLPSDGGMPSEMPFHNPILEQRADPWIYLHTDGYYYLTATVPDWDRVELRRARTINGLREADSVVAFRADEKTGMGGKIWAPEIHYIDGAWYIYVAAAGRPNAWDVRMWVLENTSPNPLEGTWERHGPIKTNWDSFSLDATTFEHAGQRYLVWAQRKENGKGNSDLWIAAMENPWTIHGRQVLLTTPAQPWEREKYRVNEGPAVLKRNGRIFITYSANATDHTYAMGMLTADQGSDLLDPASWAKSPGPVFQTSEANRQYGPGHNSFTRTADGTDVLVYHARPYREVRDPLLDPNRHMRAQPFTWTEDGTPAFGEPEADSTPREAFLLTFFRDNGQHGVYLAASDDGRTFRELNGGRPILTPPRWPDQDLTRDPSVVYHDGLFHMVWTSHWEGRIFGYATSPDLQTWSEPVAVRPFPDDLPEEDQPKNVWAPEIHWDPVQEDFLVLFSSTTERELRDRDSKVAHGRDHRTYAVRMKDGRFGAARRFLDRGISLIDPAMVYDPDAERWVMIIKHELQPQDGGKNFRIAFAPADLEKPFPPSFTELSDPIVGPGSPLRPDEWIEGPSLVRRGDRWMLFGDAYGAGHYTLITSKDLETWRDDTEGLEMPRGARHGTVFRAPVDAVKWLEEAPVPLTLDPDSVLNRIDENIYGHFFEHIYHSANGGLWGELIWNRSFEQNNAGRWAVEDGELRQASPSTDVRLLFGDAAWEDYEFTLEARKDGGAEGFLVLFRAGDDEAFYWANLGGWGNDRHQIERSAAGGSRGSVGPSFDGRIETGRWYGIKVRCEGGRFRVWLNDEEMIDYTDRRPHIAGRVGLGTWSTQASFRNVRVADLEGNLLYEGLPEPTSKSDVAEHWRTFGPVRLELDAREPLNSHFAVKLTADDSGAGLEQAPFALRHGETYRGSLWVRGHAPDGLAVRLVDDGKVMSETTVPAPGPAWAEKAFALPCEVDRDDAAFRIALLGPGEVWIDQVSMMPESWATSGGFRPDLLGAVAALRPPVIRWPGGCFASPYRWKDGIGPQHERKVYPREIWDDLDVNSLGTDEFMELCRRTGAEPLVVVNIGTESWNPLDHDTYDFLQDALDWLEYCNGGPDTPWGRRRAENGHPEPYDVKYWEIDNETWGIGAEAYAEAVNRFAPALRKADPSITILACGSGGYSQDWNRKVIELAGKNIDYISTHHYENPNAYATGIAPGEAYYRELKTIIDEGPNPDMQIYCSEWNAQSTDWRTGLYCGGLLNVFERCGDFFTLGGPALFLRHVSATGWDNAFINFDHTGWFPAPNYVVMKLWRDHYAPNRVALEGETGGLNLVATTSEDGNTVYVKVVNPGDAPREVSVRLTDGFIPGPASMQVVDPGALQARNTLDRPDLVTPRSSEVTVADQEIRWTLPPLSAAVVTVPRSTPGD